MIKEDITKTKEIKLNFSDKRSEITSHLGRNPINGGSPPKESINLDLIMNDFFLADSQKLEIILMLFVLV